MSRDREIEAGPGEPQARTSATEAPSVAEDATLGGYFRVHDRPPGFEGSDGHPYTVSIEVEKVPDLRAPWEGFLVFPRWAQNGLGIVGHVETPSLWRGASPDEVRRAAGETPLPEVQSHLNTAIRDRADDARR